MAQDNSDYKIPSLSGPQSETSRRNPRRVSCGVAVWRRFSYTSSSTSYFLSFRLVRASQMIVVSRALALSAHIVKFHLNLYAKVITCKIAYGIYNLFNSIFWKIMRQMKMSAWTILTWGNISQPLLLRECHVNLSYVRLKIYMLNEL